MAEVHVPIRTHGNPGTMELSLITPCSNPSLTPANKNSATTQPFSFSILIHEPQQTLNERGRFQTGTEGHWVFVCYHSVGAAAVATAVAEQRPDASQSSHLSGVTQGDWSISAGAAVAEGTDGEAREGSGEAMVIRSQQRSRRGSAEPSRVEWRLRQAAVRTARVAWGSCTPFGHSTWHCYATPSPCSSCVSECCPLYHHPFDSHPLCSPFSLSVSVNDDICMCSFVRHYILTVECATECVCSRMCVCLYLCLRVCACSCLC